MKELIQVLLTLTEHLLNCYFLQYLLHILLVRKNKQYVAGLLLNWLDEMEALLIDYYYE